MLTDNALIAWICMYRLQCGEDCNTFIPTTVQTALVAKGWLEIEAEPDWQGAKQGHITDAGIAVCDLNAADFGIDALAEAG